MITETNIMSVAKHFWNSFLKNSQKEFINFSFTRFILLCLIIAIATHLTIYIYSNNRKKDSLKYGDTYYTFIMLCPIYY